MQTSDSSGSGIYWIGFALTALPTFLGCWAYAIYEYGFLLAILDFADPVKRY